MPYYPEKAQETLGVYDAFILVDARRPVAFFGWPGAPSYYTRDDQEHLPLGGGGQDILAVLAALADALDAPAMPTVPAPAARDQGTPTGPLTSAAIGAVLAAAQPEGAIIVNEGVTIADGTLEKLRGIARLPTRISVTLADGAGITAPSGGQVAWKAVRDRTFEAEVAPENKISILRDVTTDPAAVAALHVVEPTLDELYAHFLGGRGMMR